MCVHLPRHCWLNFLVRYRVLKYCEPRLALCELNAMAPSDLIERRGGVP